MLLQLPVTLLGRIIHGIDGLLLTLYPPRAPYGRRGGKEEEQGEEGERRREEEGMILEIRTRRKVRRRMRTEG